MSHWNRLKYAFVMGTIAVGLLMVIDMILHIGIGDFIFSPVFFVPIVVLGYLFAPLLEKYIKY